jgi:hypothetical protein
MFACRTTVVEPVLSVMSAIPTRVERESKPPMSVPVHHVGVELAPRLGGLGGVLDSMALHDRTIDSRGCPLGSRVSGCSSRHERNQRGSPAPVADGKDSEKSTVRPSPTAREAWNSIQPPCREANVVGDR